MRALSAMSYPPDKQRLRKKAMKLEWATIGFMLSIILALYLTMGSSQAMRTAWLEDILALVPPIAILIAARFENREPNESFPYGYFGTISVAFLTASLALLGLGVYVLIESTMALIQAHRPTIGTMVLFGQPIWLGWLMIAALVYSMIPPVILGRMKLKVAEELHDKALHADAAMNKADWLTAGAAIVGILGIGIGWWWADAVAAIVISLDICLDGLKNTKRVIQDIMDHRPTTVDKGEPLQLTEKIVAELRRLEWVADADARLREEGHVLMGEAFVVPRTTERLVERIDAARDAVQRLDWRLADVSIVPTASLSRDGGADEDGHLDPPSGGTGRGGEHGRERRIGNAAGIA